MSLMLTWIKISLLLCVFGFLKEFRPSEPYIYEYLTSAQWHNLTEESVMQNVYPVTTYSYIGLLIFVFLITDFLRYKPLIVSLSISGIIIWATLLWSHGLLAVQIVEVIYGFFMAAEVAYYTYIYAKVPKEHYQYVTSCTRIAILTGRFTSAIVAQCFIYFHILNIKQLNYLTFGAMILATFWSWILLPSVSKSLYFNQPETVNLNTKNKSKLAFQLLWQHTKTAYTNVKVIKWSIWWAMATCGFLQVESYIQPLWLTLASTAESESDVENVEKNMYNAGVTATLTIIGALGSVLAGMLKINWDKYGEIMLAICSAIGGCGLILSTTTNSIWVSYLGYIIFGSFYHVMITVANFIVASDIPEDSYALIFGVNTFFALILQTILIQVIVSDNGFQFGPHKQFIVYGGYHIAIAFIFILFYIIGYIMRKRNNKQSITTVNRRRNAY